MKRKTKGKANSKLLFFLVGCLLGIVPIFLWWNAGSVWRLPANYAQAENVASYDQFLARLQELKTGEKDDFRRAVKVMSLVRSKVSRFDSPGINETKDMRSLFEQMSAGKPAFCNDVATLEEYAFSTIGTKAVRWHLTAEDGVSTHSTVDVYIEDRNKWVLLDPTFAGYFTLDSVPQSVPEIHTLLVSGQKDKLKFVRVGEWESPRPETFLIDPLLEYYTVERTNPIIPSDEPAVCGHCTLFGS